MTEDEKREVVAEVLMILADVFSRANSGYWRSLIDHLESEVLKLRNEKQD